MLPESEPAAHTARPFSPAVEDYLKAVFELQERASEVTTNALARAMNTSAAAASKMMKYLAGLNLVQHSPYQGVRLTESGTRVALEVIRHHRLLEQYLHEALGYGWDEVDAEAEKLEHHISEEFEDRIDRMLNFPRTDPHGHPIPTRDLQVDAPLGTPLSGFAVGETVCVRRVADSDPEMLRFLGRMGLVLNTEVHIVAKQPFNGPISLQIGGCLHIVGLELAAHVFAERVTG